MSAEFYKKLLHKVVSSLPNDYEDNYEYERFGEKPAPKTLTGKLYNTKFVTDRFINKGANASLLYGAKQLLEDPLFDKFGKLYKSLANDESRELLVDLVAYMMLGYKKVKLPLNTHAYWQDMEKCSKYFEKASADGKSGIYNLKPLGYDIKLNITRLGVLTDFIIEQYHYKSKGRNICVEEGDVVIDGGGFWGDTALYFASKAGSKGKVYTFEFIPGNLKQLKENLSYNPSLAANIEIVEHPLWEKDKMDFYYIDKGSASTVSMEDIGTGSQRVQSKTIDALVAEKQLQKVDFIKMDIEGAEPYALRGAEETIRKFKPKLAIAIYHSVSDFVNIPEYINSLGLGYKLYLGHYTIYGEETLIFATT